VTPQPRIEAWLLTTQLWPTFAAHDFVRRASVLIIPPGYMKPGEQKRIELMIFYGMGESIHYDDCIDAIVEGTQDPNLPQGVSNYDLFRPIVWPAGVEKESAPPFVFSERTSFDNAPRVAENDYFSDLDAFAVLLRVCRTDAGLEQLQFDAGMAERIDRWLATLA